MRIVAFLWILLSNTYIVLVVCSFYGLLLIVFIAYSSKIALYSIKTIINNLKNKIHISFLRIRQKVFTTNGRHFEFLQPWYS